MLSLNRKILKHEMALSSKKVIYNVTATFLYQLTLWTYEWKEISTELQNLSTLSNGKQVINFDVQKSPR